MKRTAKSLSRIISKRAKTQKKQPGIELKMRPIPKPDDSHYLGSHKLENKTVIITGGDSGIGHSTAIFFAKEGADIVIAYRNEHKDAKHVEKEVKELGRKCLLISGDLSKEAVCKKIITKTLKHFNKIDVLINCIAVQYPQKSITDITARQLLKTFETNVFSYFYMIKHAVPYLKRGSSIINTASITCYRGSENLLDYSSTKGAIVALTRSLSKSLIKKGIRVNAVAPGPVWTPLIPSSFSKAHIKKFGQDVPMERPAQPEEIAPSYVFLASDDSSYISGQVLHPNGGVVVNG